MLRSGWSALRIGVAWRWAALALVIGSLMAITGIDRLAHVAGAPHEIFMPIALSGVALNGFAWILLGVGILVPGFRA